MVMERRAKYAISDCLVVQYGSYMIGNKLNRRTSYVTLNNINQHVHLIHFCIYTLVTILDHKQNKAVRDCIVEPAPLQTYCCCLTYCFASVHACMCACVRMCVRACVRACIVISSTILYMIWVKNVNIDNLRRLLR